MKLVNYLFLLVAACFLGLFWKPTGIELIYLSLFSGLLLTMALIRIPSFIKAILLGTLFFYLMPRVFFDDAGFIWRYMFQAEQGYWFTFNQNEGTVYGMSSFLFGILASGLNIIVKNPGTVLLLLNFSGTLLFVWACLLLIRRAGFTLDAMALSLPLFTALGPYVSFSGGLETSWHVATVLFAFYFLWAEKPKLFLLASAMAILFKLDSTPVVAAMGIVWFFHRPYRMEYKFSLALVWGAIPLALGLITIYAIYGQILPHSAASKISLHSNTDPFFSPFLRHYFDFERRLAIFILWGLLIPFQIRALIKKEIALYSFVPLFGFIGLCFLFHLYNPRERMLWYYALPDALAGLGMLFSVNSFPSPFKFKFIIIPFLLLGFNQLFNDAKYYKWFLYTLEVERGNLGAAIPKLYKNGESLAVWHGMFGREWPGKVYDMSALNSKETALWRRDSDSLELRSPDYIIGHLEPYWTPQFLKAGYAPIGFYGDAGFFGEGFLLMKKMNLAPLSVWKHPAVSVDDLWSLNGNDTLDLMNEKEISGLLLVVMNKSDSLPQSIQLNILLKDGLHSIPAYLNSPFAKDIPVPQTNSISSSCLSLWIPLPTLPQNCKITFNAPLKSGVDFGWGRYVYLFTFD
jgi:hypothetical protein